MAKNLNKVELQLKTLKHLKNKLPLIPLYSYVYVQFLLY